MDHHNPFDAVTYPDGTSGGLKSGSEVGDSPGGAGQAAGRSGGAGGEWRVIMRKHGYPPDMQEKATQTVLEQAELMAEGLAA